MARQPWRRSWIRRVLGGTLLSPLWWDGLFAAVEAGWYAARKVRYVAVALLLLAIVSLGALKLRAGGPSGQQSALGLLPPGGATPTSMQLTTPTTVMGISSPNFRAATAIRGTPATRTTMIAIRTAVTTRTAALPTSPPPIETAIPMATYTPPPATPRAVLPSTPTPTPVPTQVTAPSPILPTAIIPTPPPAPTATRDSAAILQQRVAASVNDLQYGTFQVTIDYGSRKMSVIQFRFDLADTGQGVRGYSRITFQGQTGTRSEEHLQLGTQQWQRRAGQQWQQESATVEPLSEQLRQYLPALALAKGVEVSPLPDGQLLRWHDADRAATITLAVNDTTGQPFHLTQQPDASDTRVDVEYVGWNTPVTFPSAP